MTRLLCIGDSITDCGRIWSAPPLGNGYVHILSDKLNAERNTWDITNCGMDGFTVQRLLENAKSSYLPQNPDIITILIGINDVGLMMNTDRTSVQQAEMMEEFYKKYDELLDCLTKNGTQIILMEPFIFPWPAIYKTWIPHVRSMSAKIRNLSEKYGVPYLLLHDLLNEEALRYGLDFITTDGIHLTTEGHQLLCRQLLPILRRLN